MLGDAPLTEGWPPVSGQWITLADVGRREVDPVIYDVLVELTARDWRLRRQGHKFYAYCPCGDPRGKIRIDGTPQNPANQARRALRQAGHCPADHDRDGSSPGRGVSD